MRIYQAVEVINQMQAASIIERYAIGGAVGATFYLEPFATLDVDIFISIAPQPGQLILSLRPLFDYLQQRGYAAEGEYVIIENWPVQFLPPSGPLVEEALAEAAPKPVNGTQTRVFSAEHLAAIALQTGRAKDKNRLLQFVQSGVLDTARFQEILLRHQLSEKWERFNQQFLQEPS